MNKKIDGLEEGGQALFQRRSLGDLEGQPHLFYFFLGPDQPLGHGLGRREVGAGDLANPEPADHLQGQHGLLVRRQRRVAGHEHERQRVVEAAGVGGLGEAQAPGGVLVEGGVARLVAQPVEGAVAGRHGEPAGRVPGHAVEGPAGQRRAEGLLDGILDDVEAGGAEQAGEPGGDLAGLAPEEVADERVLLGHGAHIRWIWRTSMRPP